MYGIDVTNDLLRECVERIAEVRADLQANPLHAIADIDADGISALLKGMPADVRSDLLYSALRLVWSAMANGFAQCQWSLYSGDDDHEDDGGWEEKTANVELDQGMTMYCPFDKCSMVSIDILKAGKPASAN